MYQSLFQEPHNSPTRCYYHHSHYTGEATEAQEVAATCHSHTQSLL